MAGYKKYISEAMRLKEKDREIAEKKAAIKKEGAYAISPKLYEIDKEKAEVMVGLSKALMSGGDYLTEINKIQYKIDTLQAEKETILAERNLTSNDLLPKYSCSICSDKGIVDGQICSCVKTLAKSLMLEAASGYSMMSDCSFENFDLTLYPQKDKAGNNARQNMQKVLEVCKDFSDNFSYNNLFFVGRTGLGKTHLSLSIAKELLNKGIDVYYASAPTLFMNLEKERFSRDRVSSDCLDAVLNCDLLIIDDLGTELKTQFTVSMLYHILNERLNAKRPMIISSNLSVQEIHENYEERIASRLFGNFDGYMFFGNDIRRIKKS